MTAQRSDSLRRHCSNRRELRRALRSRDSALLARGHDDLDAPVLRAAMGGCAVSARAILPDARRGQPVLLQPFRLEVRAHRLGTLPPSSRLDSGVRVTGVRTDDGRSVCVSSRAACTRCVLRADHWMTGPRERARASARFVVAVFSRRPWHEDCSLVTNEMSSDPETAAIQLVRGRARRVERSGVRPSPTLPAAGVVVADRYSLLRAIGEGGMAAVWLAHDQWLDCLCALKLLHADQARDPEVRSRFEREAAVVARIRSTNVVRIIDRGQWQGLPYIAMEYLAGEDLRARLQHRGRLERWEAYEVIAQIARGLTLVHARGVVHRDVKPENIFLAPDASGEVAKLLDFGVAKQLVPSPTEASTLAGLFLGTVDYASPEQLRGANVDWRSDLWSLSVVAFECLTGSRPFVADSPAELCGAVLHEPLPRVTEYDGELPPEFEAWLERALARDPERRFQSARELADALAVALACERTTIPSLPPRATLESEPGEDAATTPPLPREHSTRWLWLGGMALVTACGFAGGFWLGVRSDSTSVAGRASADAAAEHPTPELAGLPTGHVSQVPWGLGDRKEK